MSCLVTVYKKFIESEGGYVMRQSKTSTYSGQIKVLAVSVALAAIASGNVVAYASQGYSAIRIGTHGQIIRISDLQHQAYRQRVIDAFNGAQRLYYRGDSIGIEPDDWVEFSASGNARGNLLPAISHNEFDSLYFPYDI
jgi:hypothetical protein